MTLKGELAEIKARLQELVEHVHAIANKVNVLWLERHRRRLKEAREKKDDAPEG